MKAAGERTARDPVLGWVTAALLQFDELDLAVRRTAQFIDAPGVGAAQRRMRGGENAHTGGE